MKTVSSIAMVLLCMTKIVAQVVLLDTSIDLIKAKEYGKALEALRKAEQNPATIKEARTYYLKAFLLKEHYSAKGAVNREDYRQSAVDAIAKCRSLDEEKKYEKSLIELENFIAASTFNGALDLFSSGEFQKSISEFTFFMKMTDADSSSWLDACYYTGVAYTELKRYDSAIVRLEKVKSKKNDRPLLYIDLLSAYLAQGNQNRALMAIDEGAEKYPNDDAIRIAQVNLYSELKRYKELEPLLESLLTKHPDNIEMMLVAATTYEHNKSDSSKQTYREKIIKLYKSILALEPDNYEANYNLGVLYYNEGVDLINQKDIDTDLEQLTKVLEKSTTLFEQSLPYLVSIFNSKKTDLKLLSALQGIYYNLNMKPEFNQITKLVNEIASK